MEKKYLTIPLILFIVDRSIKYLAPSINIEGGFVKIGFYQNYSGAFSLPISGTIYNIAGIFFIFLLLYFFINAMRKMRTHANAANIPMAYLFIVFGGLSNVFDRLYYGYTIDYFNFINWSFFNLADGMLIMGILFLIISRKKI